jgi:hypothetical protein
LIPAGKLQLLVELSLVTLQLLDLLLQLLVGGLIRVSDFFDPLIEFMLHLV